MTTTVEVAVTLEIETVAGHQPGLAIDHHDLPTAGEIEAETMIGVIEDETTPAIGRAVAVKAPWTPRLAVDAMIQVTAEHLLLRTAR